MYNFPDFVAKAFSFLQNTSNPVVAQYNETSGHEDELVRYAEAYAKYIGLVVEYTSNPDKTVRDAVVDSGLSDFSAATKAVFGYAFQQVVLSAYYAGFKEANVGEFQPFVFAGPQDILASAKKPTTWITRLISSLKKFCLEKMDFSTTSQ